MLLYGLCRVRCHVGVLLTWLGLRVMGVRRGPALASWRLGDWNAASTAFQQVAQLAQQRELRAGGYYWAARAEQAAARPARSSGCSRRRRTPTRRPKAFTAWSRAKRSALPTRLTADPFIGSDPPIDQYPNVQRAIELAKIGEPGRAEELLRHQAKIGVPTEHHALIQLARRLDLPAAQLWLADNGQWGARSDATDRIRTRRGGRSTAGVSIPPSPTVISSRNSAFRRTAISQAGAVGLMQVLPVTAQLVSRNRGVPYTRAALTDPTYNLEYGQSFIEMMRTDPGTAGQLPRIIASYNAGPLPVARWAGINDKGDPLLWIESIPYRERAIMSPPCFGTCGSIRASMTRTEPRCAPWPSINGQASRPA